MNGNVKAPWHLWAVGVITLLWNGFGASQWYMQVMKVRSYYADMTLEQVQFIQAQPVWVEIVFGVGVWTGVLGALMLLLRRKLAFNAFVASLIAVLANTVYMQVLTNGRELFGVGTLYAAIAVIVVAAASAAYAHFARSRGIIR
ncbi:hypothetical protein [uncultured Brevundimonas sp.]|uniref:hypothetical protein n=1 Tax=uncultured Brevundimonas sp. TaxID=213418 RepID=UPI002608FA5E|nr:hypothetical protein [uncultured Brevundimonas sp.]